MKRKINVALCGYGYWGKNLLRNLFNLDNVNVKYVCDLNPDNLKRAVKAHGFDSAIYTTEFTDILTDTEVEAVVLSTPPGSHYLLGQLALAQNKHVFIEKPMTTKAEEAYELVQLAKSKNRVLMTGHTFVYCPGIQDLKKMIDSGELGEIYYMDYVMTNLGKYQPHNILWDLAPHGISIAQYLLNNEEVEDISINGLETIREGLMDVAYLTLYYKNRLVNMHFSWLNPNKERRLTVVGSKKMAVFNDIDPLEKIRVYDKGVTEEKNFTSWGESLVGYRHGNITIPNTQGLEPLRKELGHFINCIETGKTPITDGENGLEVVSIIETANDKFKRRKQ